MNNYLIEVKNLQKVFHVGSQDVQVLRGISFEVMPGDFTIIIGPSGCGKSTLLHTILGLEPPTDGEVFMLNKNLYDKTTEDDRSEFRKRHIGMIYQQPNWVRSLNVIENVAFPLLLLGVEKKLATERAFLSLREVKMERWATNFASELSGGQQQRVALARALVVNPDIIIADEPTGNLDYQAGQDVMQLLSDLNQNSGKAIVMVTHDLEYLKYCKRAVQLLDGKVVNVYDGEGVNDLMANLPMKRGVTQEQAKIN